VLESQAVKGIDDRVTDHAYPKHQNQVRMSP